MAKKEILLYKDDMIAFGKWVYEKRMELGMTLDELAEKVGICKAYLSRLERGERINPSFVTVYTLSKALGRKTLDNIIQTM